MMPAMEWPALKPLVQALEQGIPPLILVSGAETFLHQETLDLLKTRLLPAGLEDLTSDWFTAKEASVERIVTAARTLPMISHARLVVVRGAEGWTAEEWNALVSYLEHPSPTTCLCITASKTDARWKGIQAWKKHGLILAADPPSERQLQTVIRGLAHRKGLLLASEAVDALAESVGPSIGMLDNVLERLACAALPGQVMTVEDVEQTIPVYRETTAFAWVDAMASGQREEALRLLQRQMDQGEAVLKLLALLARHVRLLRMAHFLMSKPSRPSAADVAKQLAVPPFVAVKLLEQARGLPLARLDALHEQLYQLDRTVKKTRLSEWSYLQAMVLRV